MEFETFEDRLENWSRVVRLPKFQSGVCAQWARWYVSIRDSTSKYAGPPVSILRDELDAWKVEAAWSQMQGAREKWPLKYHYIWNMSGDQVITRMRKTHEINLRGRPWEVVLVEAQRALKKKLVNFEELDKLFARVPNPLRRELLDAPRQVKASVETAAEFA
jgi:hypothetical protein